MAIFRISVIAGALLLAAPGAALAASAGFFASAGGTLTIDPPGATIEIDPEEGGVFPVRVEAGTALIDVVSGVDTPTDSANAAVSGTAAAPLGIADALFVAGSFLKVVNETAAPILATLEWDIGVMTDSIVSAGADFSVDAFSTAIIELFAYVAMERDPEFPNVSQASVAVPSHLFFAVLGPQSAPDASRSTFAIAPGGTMFGEVYGAGGGYAEVLPVPLPASLALAMTGLAGLGALRLRPGLGDRRARVGSAGV